MGMRIGGAFPINQSGAFPLTLTGGEIVYPPPGNYLLTLGGQTVLQWWDPIQYSWRNASSPLAQTFQISMDGYNFRLINMSGVVQGASITTAGTAGVNGIGPTNGSTAISFAAGGTGTGNTAKGYAIVGGAVQAPTTTAAGSGFLQKPLILIDPPPIGGIQATATVALTAGGGLGTVTMVNAGAGYTTTPNFYVVPQFETYPGAPKDDPYGPASAVGVQYAPAGSVAGVPTGASGLPTQAWGIGLQPSANGALLTPAALTGSGTTTGIVMTQFGHGYTSVPAITFSGSGAPGSAAATAVMSWALTALTGGSGVAYTVGNKWESSLGYLTAGTTNNMNNNFLLPRAACGVLTSTVGALSIEDNGFGFQKVLIAGNFGVEQGTSIGTTSIAFSGIAMGGVSDTSLVQMMVNG